MDKFLIGTSTAAHQVEGNNIHSDYWLMEQMPHTNFTEPSLEAVDHYHRYEEDIKLMAQAGLNAYRFSIEWARIEPEQGKFDENEIKHYEKVIDCCVQNGIEPVITLMHFTSPAWVIKKGGWENEEVASWFADYCAYVVKHLGNKIKYICTINEANMRLQVAAIAERYKRQMMAKMQQMQAMAQASDAKNSGVEGIAQVGMNFNSMMENMKYQKMENAEVFGTPDPANFVSGCTPEGDVIVMKAHQAAKKAIKEICPEIQVGLTLSVHDIQALPGAEEVAQKEWEEEFTHYLPYISEDDFFGLQNYTRSIIGEDGIMPVPEGAKTTQMDYENYPQALRNVIVKVNEEFKEAGITMPIMITENGIATACDEERVAFIQEAFAGIQQCREENIPLLGYMHWSFLDNFEWQKGYSMTFGLVQVDRSTMKRTAKNSLYVLGDIAKNIQ